MQAASGSSGSKKWPNRTALVEPVRKPPAIPSKTQSYGYAEVVRPGELGLMALPPPADVYAGDRHESVAPNFYRPRLDMTRSQSTSNIRFSRSTEKRGIFEARPTADNFMPDKSLPGPGAYSSRSDTAPKDTTGSACFLSKSQRTSFSRNSDNQAAPGDFYASTFDTSAADIYEQNLRPAFGSAAPRAGAWKRSMNAPFTDPGTKRTPGPGQYAPSNLFSAPVARPRLLQDAVGFSSTAPRKSATAPSPSVREQPGPGEYNVDLVNSMSKEVTKRTIGRNGVFGTTSSRFGGQSNGVAFQFRGNDPTQGQGHSRTPDRPTPHHHHHQQQQQLRTAKLYRSSLSHFKPRSEDGQEEFGASKFSNSDAPPVGTYVPEVGEEKLVSNKTKQGSAAAFQSTTRRFDDKHILGVHVPDTPGPGLYGANMSDFNIKKRAGKPPGVAAMRFQYKEDDVQAAPGSYNVSQSLLKKSFNVSYSKGKRGPAKRSKHTIRRI